MRVNAIILASGNSQKFVCGVAPFWVGILLGFSELPPFFHHVGEWLSLVEHLVRDQGVGGSNPLSPTIYPDETID
jgi:hypothetical protein